MAYDPQSDIWKLMNLYEQDLPSKPTLPSKEILLLRARLVYEEALEFVTACGCALSADDMDDQGNPRVVIDEDIQPDLNEYADACGDQLVVTYGALNAAGIRVRPLWDEIQRSNMAKVWPDGTIHKRDDGKVIKPDTWTPPNIEQVLEEQMRRK